MRPLKAFSWMMDEELPGEVSRQLEGLKQLGIDEVRIGLEVEFVLPKMPIPPGIITDPLNPPEPNRHWEKVLENITTTDKDDGKKLTNAREVMMYDLLHLDPRTKGLLQPLIPKNYYDSVDVLEVQLKPTDPILAMKNHRLFMEVLEEKAYAYGLESGLTSGFQPGVHLNMSYWKNGQNIIDPFHPEFPTIGQKIVSGMTRAVHDSVPSVYGTEIMLPTGNLQSPKLSESCLGPSRTDFLSLRGSGEDARIQVPLAAEPLTCHLGMNISNMLAGAHFGLSDEHTAYKKDHMFEAKSANRLFVRHSYEHAPTLVHILTGSLVKEDGTLQPSYDYIYEAAATHGKWFGVIKPEDERVLRATPHKTTTLAKQIDSFFRQTRVVEAEGGGLTLVFPKKHPFPPEQVDDLARHIVSATVAPTLVITPGYVNDTPMREPKDIISERVVRMCESVALKSGRSADFIEGMNRSLEIHFGEPNKRGKTSCKLKEEVTVKAVRKEKSPPQRGWWPW